MRVALFTGLDPRRYSGETVYVLRVLRALRELGCDVAVYMAEMSDAHYADQKEWLDDFSIAGVSYVALSTKSTAMSMCHTVYRLIREAKRQGPWNAVLYRLGYFQTVALLRRSMFPAATLVWLHDGIVEEITFRHPDLHHRFIERIFSALEFVGSRFADWEIPVSNAMQEYSVSKGYKPRLGYHVVPCVVETDRFVPSFRDTLNLPRVTFGFAGSLSPWQGFETACAYLATIQDTGIVVQLNVLTPRVVQARAIMEQFGLAGVVKSVPHVCVPEEMNQWDFALSTQTGGVITQVCSPLKITEALAKGIPLVLTPDVGDFSRMIHEKRIGMVIHPECCEQWKGTVHQIREISQDYRRVQERARKLAEEMYSVERMLKVLRAVLSD